MQVCRAESQGNTHAVGDGHTPYVSCGVFQVRTLPGRPSCEKLKIPEVNIDFAYKLYKTNGWQPWSVCKNGMVNCKV